MWRIMLLAVYRILVLGCMAAYLSSQRVSAYVFSVPFASCSEMEPREVSMVGLTAIEYYRSVPTICCTMLIILEGKRGEESSSSAYCTCAL